MEPIAYLKDTCDVFRFGMDVILGKDPCKHDVKKKRCVSMEELKENVRVPLRTIEHGNERWDRFFDEETKVVREENHPILSKAEGCIRSNLVSYDTWKEETYDLEAKKTSHAFEKKEIKIEGAFETKDAFPRTKDPHVAIEISSDSEASDEMHTMDEHRRTSTAFESCFPKKMPRMRRSLPDDDDEEEEDVRITKRSTSPSRTQVHAQRKTSPTDSLEEMSSSVDDEEPDEDMEVNHLGELRRVSTNRRGKGKRSGGENVGRSSGRWITDGGGKRIFVMSGGKRLSGRAAYKAYNGGFSRTSKKVRKKTRTTRKPKKEK